MYIKHSKTTLIVHFTGIDIYLFLESTFRYYRDRFMSLKRNEQIKVQFWRSFEVILEICKKKSKFLIETYFTHVPNLQHFYRVRKCQRHSIIKMGRK